jgi:Papain family cysteine protease
VSRKIEIQGDLRGAFGAARNQGQRPTCLAFAASDAHAGARDGWAPLSCEFLFFHAQRRAKRPPSLGALLPDLLAALQADGQPIESGWPYLAATPAPSAWTSPANVGVRYGRLGASVAGALDEVHKALDDGRPTLMLLRLSASFYRPEPDGVVVMPAGEPELQKVRHAVVAVAYGLVDGQPAVLVRNSWGAGWGLAGHAWLTVDFVGARLFGVAVLGGEVNVSPDPKAA